MTRIKKHQRAGFTLIELMVVMGIIALLTAIVMLIAPNVMDKDRARDAATQLQGALQNARLRALRDGLPRGVRLIVDPTSLVPTPNSPPYIFVTSSAYQYIEVPPVYVTNTTTLSSYVQFVYTVNAAGAITSRACSINGLTTDQLTQIVNAVNNAPASYPATLSLPTLGFWATMSSATASSTSSCTVVLAVYPDASLGAETSLSTYQFGIYNAPRPLLGEPSMQMPVNTCIDLSDGVSSPSFSQIPGSVLGSTDYDILFNPSGQLMTPSAIGQVFLWVRDPTKGIATPGLPTNPDKNGGAFCSMSPSAPSLGSIPSSQYATFWSTANTAGPFNTALNAGGEQLLVTIKASSGGTGVAPIFWGNSPYAYAQTLP